MNEPSAIFEIIHSLINRPEGHLSVSEMCSIAGVSRSGYYAWVKAASVREAQEEQDRKDFDIILEAYRWRGYSKGARGIYMRLLHMDPPVVMNVKKIRRLMDKYNLNCPVRKANPYRRIARALKTSNVADNLIQREFECYGPRTVLLTDITYIPYNGTFAYLSTVLDAYTKQILSYVLGSTLEMDFVLETVEKLIREHGISLTQWTVTRPDDRAWKFQKALEPLLKRWQETGEEISNAYIDSQKQMEKWTKEVTHNTAINNVANNKSTVTIGDIHVTCPGVTSQQVAEQIGDVLDKELDKKFNGFYNYTDQMSRIR